MTAGPRLLLTCEHGGNRVPARYADRFRGAESVLRSHRGFDIGALAVARALARRLGAPLVAATVTRLLVDLNRSPGHPGLLSEFTADLGEEEKRRVLERHYLPHRTRVTEGAERMMQGGRAVVHVAVHSFTPRLRGEVRRADVGLLYDPARRRERALCGAWRDALRELDPDLRVRRNYPYRGVQDGLTTLLRRTFPASRYLGLELEMNQRLLRTPPGRRAMAACIAAGLARVLDER